MSDPCDLCDRVDCARRGSDDCEAHRVDWRARALVGESLARQLADRITTIADEAFGPFPIQSTDENLSAIERGIFELRRELFELRRELSLIENERDHLKLEMNTPITDDWLRGVTNEAAHQRERWGREHDAGKRPEDWIALFVFLMGKATGAHYAGDVDKFLHHLISTGAACLNAHLHATGADTRMRPGVDPSEAKPPDPLAAELAAARAGWTRASSTAVDLRRALDTERLERLAIARMRDELAAALATAKAELAEMKQRVGAVASSAGGR